ncbi:chitinase-3-like protein 1 [Arctopsyche grandis]|uniref:chitinase-3-like protein 1 n=1 Tax=Arctopsyche grandis TaxID=121162 RepID=UPI00406DA23B
MRVGVLLGLALLGLVSVASGSKKVVCYYGAWSMYRPGAGKFDVENIDPFVCTHLIYSFVGLETWGGIRVMDPWQDLVEDWGRGGYQRFNNLKKVNPQLKTIVAIGGWNEGSENYSKTFRDPLKIASFVKESVAFLLKHGFDGLDLDWEYPNQRGGEPIDIESFSNLLKALRTEFDKYGFLLTGAVAAAEMSFSLSYDVPKLAQYMDFINIMAYDFHGAWENVTGHNAPINIAAVEAGTKFEGFSADASIKAWIRYGAPPEKLVMGVGLYGRAFTLSSSGCTGPRCPVKGAGNAGPFSREAGMLGYNEICSTERNDASAVKVWDEEAQVPYMVFGNNQWVGYDDEQSAALKVEYIKANNLGGAMVWSIDTDDFSGACGKGTFPLLNVLKRGLISGSTGTTPAPTTTSAPATTAAPTTTTAPATTTTAPVTTAGPGITANPPTAAPSSTTVSSEIPSTYECRFVGYNRDPERCDVFYQCYISKGEYKFSKFTCTAGLLFDLTKNTCNYAAAVDC